MTLPPNVELKWREFLAEMNAEYSVTADDGENPSSYTERDPISDTWDTRGKIVTVDRAIFALHLLAARYAFSELPKVQTIILAAMIAAGRSLLTSTAAKKVIGNRPGKGIISTFISLVVSTVFESHVNRKMETLIRSGSLRVRTELYERPMAPNPNRERKVKLVYTRNVTPVQRKANKSWRSPKP